MALAVEEGLDTLYGDGVAVQRVDPFSQARRTTVDRLVGLYPSLLIHRSRVWRPIYYQSNRPRVLRPLLSLARRMAANQMRSVLDRVRPDIVVGVDPLTHQLAAPLLADRRTPLILVVTDLVTVHRAWVCPGVDAYLAPSTDAALALAGLGAPVDRIAVSGLPVRLAFCRAADPARLRIAYGLGPDQPIVLVSGGGSGAGGLEWAVRALLRARLAAQVVVVCGRNRRLRARLERAQDGEPGLRVCGFVEQMADFVGVASVVVTKAGSVTIAEAAAAGRPMVLIHEVPGQEDGNIGWVERNGLGLDGRKPAQLVAAVRSLLDCPAGLATRPQDLGRLVEHGTGWVARPGPLGRLQRSGRGILGASADLVAAEPTWPANAWPIDDEPAALQAARAIGRRLGLLPVHGEGLAGGKRRAVTEA